MTVALGIFDTWYPLLSRFALLRKHRLDPGPMNDVSVPSLATGLLFSKLPGIFLRQECSLRWNSCIGFDGARVDFSQKTQANQTMQDFH